MDSHTEDESAEGEEAEDGAVPAAHRHGTRRGAATCSCTRLYRDARPQSLDRLHPAPASVGYNHAASLMERMEKEGIVGQANHAGKREILVPKMADAAFEGGAEFAIWPNSGTNCVEGTKWPQPAHVRPIEIPKDRGTEHEAHHRRRRPPNWPLYRCLPALRHRLALFLCRPRVRRLASPSYPSDRTQTSPLSCNKRPGPPAPQAPNRCSSIRRFARPTYCPEYLTPNRARGARVNAYLSGVQTLVWKFRPGRPRRQQDQGRISTSRSPARCDSNMMLQARSAIIADGSSLAVRDRRLRPRTSIPLSQTPLRFLLSDRIDLLKDTDVVNDEPMTSTSASPSRRSRP